MDAIELTLVCCCRYRSGQFHRETRKRYFTSESAAFRTLMEWNRTADDVFQWTYAPLSIRAVQIDNDSQIYHDFSAV